MRIIQFKESGNPPRVGMVEGAMVNILGGFESTYNLAQSAIHAGLSLQDFIRDAGFHRYNFIRRTAATRGNSTPHNPPRSRTYVDYRDWIDASGQC